MVLSLAAILAPGDLLAPLRHLTQLLVYSHVGAREPGLLASEIISESAIENLSPDTYRQMRQQNRTYEREVLSLRQELQRVRASRDALAGIREAGLSDQAKLIPVRIASTDAVPGRESLWLAGGTRQGIAAGDWAVSHTETEAVGPQGNIEQILPRECVLGWIEQVQGLTSRLVLLSDSTANKALRVQVEGRNGAPIDLVLQGRDAGRMRIPDIPSTWVDEGLIEVGELVTTAGEEPRLPVRLVVGRIVELTRHRDQWLFFDAVVEPGVSPARLHEAYVIHIDTGEIPSARP
jgi:cell shape-determining protein MreC